MTIDINCDMGESFGAYKIGNDQDIFPYISSCNVACGAHGGDPLHIDRTLRLAVKFGVRIGAHPGYPDLQGFGRRPMQMSDRELNASIRYQVSALAGMAKSVGGEISYVKPHGALYNTACSDETVCKAIVDAIRNIDPHLSLMGLAGSQMGEIAQREGISFIAEAFADRAYEDNGLLRSRSMTGAVHSDPALACDQVISIATRNEVITFEGSTFHLEADSFCIHGDNPAALSILKELENKMSQNGLERAKWK